MFQPEWSVVTSLVVPTAAFLLTARSFAQVLGLPAVFVCEKLSKRHDQDIATVGAAFLVEIAAGVVQTRIP